LNQINFSVLEPIGLLKAKKLPGSVDLRNWCSPVENQGRIETTGALLIRNLWGKHWGEEGYGWLLYEYTLKGLGEDFWSILKKGWIDTGQFTK
jgi:C1A family cysteine protease